jgi:DNA-binding PucR family transcriptional regulator
VACLEERLPAALLTARPDLARELSTRVLGPVLNLDKVSRDLLLDTLAAWLAADGSALRAASSLYCHRNTVLNRMRRLERLTRRSLSAPNDLVELALALEAFGLATSA